MALIFIHKTAQILVFRGKHGDILIISRKNPNRPKMFHAVICYVDAVKVA